MTLDEKQVDCRVFTYKEGALSAIAHDLELAVTRLTVEVGDDLSIDARFDATSLRVLHAMEHGRPTEALSPADKQKIEHVIVADVLAASRHPEIRFRAPAPLAGGDEITLSGELTLCGRTHPVTVRARRDGERHTATVALTQSDFGIKPYRALLGALRVKDGVEIRVSVPLLSRGA